MKNMLNQLKRLVVLIAAGLWAGSCVEGLVDHFGNPACDYTVRLRYDYNRENSTTENMIDYYVRSLEAYIFDERGILLRVSPVVRDICDGTWYSELDLPAGRYSVIAVGNRDARSRIRDEATGNTPVCGQTRREDMRMELDNAVALAGDTRGPSEPLYHGYRTFTIERDEVGYVRVDMVHAHLVLKFRATWKGGSAPTEKTNYFTLLEIIPSQYALMPEFYYPKGSFTAQVHDPAACDLYEASSDYVIHHIPHTNYLDLSTLSYRCDTYINNDNELWGEFTAYRVKNATAVLLKIFHWDEGAQTATNMLQYDIDLRNYLTNHLGANLDHTLRQEYILSIEIEEGIATVKQLTVADWDEGGVIPAA